MVKRLFPSNSDFDNLSVLRTEVGEEAAGANFSDVVVRKPWGYEYLWFQNADVAVWMLHLAAASATSLHCHVRKRTSLIPVAGTVLCTTLEGQSRLRSGDALVLEPCVFHSTRALSPEGAFVMEIETPPLKGDLVRLRDAFGRVGMGYEGSSQYSSELNRFDYHPWSRIGAAGDGAGYKEVHLRYSVLRCADDLRARLMPDAVVVPFLGRLQFGRELIADIGEAIASRSLDPEACPAAIPPVEILQIARTQPAP